MKNTNSFRKWTLGLGVVALALAPAMAQGWGEGRRDPGRGPGDRPERLARLAKALDLTEEQRDQIREIRRTHADGALGTYRDAMREARRALRAVMHDPAATDMQVQEAANAVAAQAALVAVERHRMTVEIDAILTPEQRQKAAELRQNRQERNHDRARRRFGGF